MSAVGPPFTALAVRSARALTSASPSVGCTSAGWQSRRVAQLFGGVARRCTRPLDCLRLWLSKVSNPGMHKGANCSSFLSGGRPCLAYFGSRSSPRHSTTFSVYISSAAMRIQPSPGVSHRTLATPRGVCELCSMGVHDLGHRSGENCPVGVVSMVAVHIAVCLHSLVFNTLGLDR